MHSELKVILTQQLIQFGLRPKDWRVTVTKNQVGLVRNRIDGAFQFRGQINSEPGQVRWKNLSLIKI